MEEEAKSQDTTMITTAIPRVTEQFHSIEGVKRNGSCSLDELHLSAPLRSHLHLLLPEMGLSSCGVDLRARLFDMR